MATKKPPTTLIEAIRYFSDADVATEFTATLRWPEGPTCPRCESKEYSYLSTRRVWKCKACKKQYSVKVGTIFEDSPIGLDKWLPAIWLVANCKNGISSHEMHRDLGVTQKTAWFMLHRIRLAMQTGTFKKFSGEVEVDETFIGGKARNMHPAKRKANIHGTGGTDKATVMGFRHRDGQVEAKVVADTTRKSLLPEIQAHVQPGSTVYTDSHNSYSGLSTDYVHGVIDHAQTYVEGRIHTNGLENFWSLLKRGLSGTYVSVQPYHLHRYIDEQVYRYNSREWVDVERFQGVLGNVEGRRVTYKSLTGKGQSETR
jgi:transposase-like protein